MARGNQRDKAREKNQKEQAGKVRLVQCPSRLIWHADCVQKSKNTMSGTEFARDKENVAAIMRAKQAAGTPVHMSS